MLCDMSKIKFQNNLQDIFAEYFAQTGLNVNSFSSKFNLSESKIYYWLNGTYLPTIKNYIILADIFQCSVDYLIGITENRAYVKSENPVPFLVRFEQLMQEKGCTKYSLAKECRIGNSAVSKWSKGKIPNTENMVNLAEYFGCSVDYLTGRSDIR